MVFKFLLLIVTVFKFAHLKNALLPTDSIFAEIVTFVIFLF